MIGVSAQLGVENTGTIQGEVLLDGVVPDPPQIRADRNVGVCGAILSDNPLIVQNQGVQGTVISLDWQGDLVPQSNPADDLPEIFVGGKHCRFDPRIQVAPVGTHLIFGSKDPIAHNPHGWWKSFKDNFQSHGIESEFQFPTYPQTRRNLSN